jgi:hypothetical protein
VAFIAALILFHLGTVFASQEKKSDARMYLQQSLANGRADNERKDAQILLEQLDK